MTFMEPVKTELELVEKEIYDSIPAKPSEVYGMLPGFIKRGGKRIRPLLTLLTCKACGGNPTAAIKTAALIEIFHNFTLVHDDIEDNSQMRRGEPTLNVKYGIPVALNSGDALYTLLWKGAAKLELEPAKIIELQDRMASAFLKVVEGQGIELGWHNSKKIDVSEKEYLSMIEGKTGALVALSCEAGAFLAGADTKIQEKMRSFGMEIGRAFQIHDDVLNVVGDFEKYGKEIGGDITEGKRTLMIAKAFEKADKKDAEELKRILLTNSAKQQDISRAIEILKGTGAVEYAKNQAAGAVAKAKGHLASLKTGPARDALTQVADFTIQREA
jgi:geranylgeranyl diphosphate synthase type I